MRRLLALLLVMFATPAAASAATLQPIGTFTDPVFVTSEPLDPDRLLVVEQAGRSSSSDHGVAKTFLDLTRPTNLVSAGGERGLLSVALAPDYSTSHRLYVFYTGTDGDLKVDEFTAAGDAADIATRRPVLRIEHSTYGNHNGGQLAFGPDGYLYIGTGDGGSGGDPFQSGQTTSSLLGKVLRIDPTPGATPYAIPAGNPFADGRLGAPEVWSYGLRNPWRFSFDRSTGALLIGDVGQGSREEIDYAAQPAAGAGLNFGWNCREGGIAYSAPGALCTGASGFTDPIFDYGHSGGNCSITGGYVVRDTSLGDLYGRYLYADVCVGQVRSLIPGPTASGDRSEGLTVSSPSSFGEDSCGRVYVTSLGNDVVSRFTAATPIDCSNVPPPPGTQPPPPGTDPPTDDPAPQRCGDEPATRVAGTSRTVLGSPGNDVIVADERANRVKGGAGDDVICGLAGDDVLRGGPGADTLRGGHGDDRCITGPGDRTRSC